MSKKRPHHQAEALPTKSITYRHIYTAEAGWLRRQSVVSTLICLMLIVTGSFVLSIKDGLPPITIMGQSLFYRQQLFASCCFLVGAFVFLASLLGTLHSVVIDGEELIFSYQMIDNIYKASDVQSIDWATGRYLLTDPGIQIVISYRQQFPGDLGPTGDGMHGRYTFLSVRMKNGKQLRIPGSPYSDVTMREILLDWRERYQVPLSESPAAPN